VFDFEGAKTASPLQLNAVNWEPVPQWIQPVNVLDPLDVSLIETVYWLSGFAAGGRLTKRIVGFYVRSSWTNPDGVREKSEGAGLVLSPGAFHRFADASSTEAVDFLAVGTDKAPPDEALSREAPLLPTGRRSGPEGSLGGPPVEKA
jgi:hypothetical protein